MYYCAKCQEGLGNRLKAVLSAMRMADKFGGEPCVYWHPFILHHGTSYQDYSIGNFADLFTTPILQVPQLIAPHEGVIRESWRFWLQDDELPEYWSKKPQASWYNQGRAIDLEYNRVPTVIKEDYLRHVAKLTPLPEIIQQADRLSKGHYIAVHYRDGGMHDKRQRTTPLEKVFRAMDAYPPQTEFFLSQCCGKSVISAMESRYPRRIRYQPESLTCEPFSIRGIQVALIDMLCLARGRELIYSYKSTFCEMAWWFGGCVQKAIDPRTVVIHL